ncbi:hypothetical protein BKA80DRAFT_137454 [Phyllosticta citrichinensis]
MDGCRAGGWPATRVKQTDRTERPRKGRWWCTSGRGSLLPQSRLLFWLLVNGRLHARGADISRLTGGAISHGRPGQWASAQPWACSCTLSRPTKSVQAVTSPLLLVPTHVNLACLSQGCSRPSLPRSLSFTLPPQASRLASVCPVQSSPVLLLRSLLSRSSFLCTLSSFGSFQP